MQSDLHISGTINETNDNYVATQQKVVYKWYESQHSDDEVVTIYSSEWQKRITSWYEHFVKTYGTKNVAKDIVMTWKSEEDIDLTVFFFAHPIAAFSLWHVLEAFYGLDEAVCGTSSNGPRTLAKWRKMKPFVYLLSKGVEERWKRELKRLNKEIECEDLKGEELKARMYAILRGVERLEMTLAMLRADFRLDQDEVERAEWMMDTIRHAADERCEMIATFLKAGKSNDADHVVADEETSYDSSLGDSAHNSSGPSSLESSRVQTGLSDGDTPPLSSSPLHFDFLSSDPVDLIILTVVLILGGIFLSLVTVSGIRGIEFMSRNYA